MPRKPGAIRRDRSLSYSTQPTRTIGSDSGVRPPEHEAQNVSSEGIANSRPDRAWWKQWRNRLRFRWSALELREDTARSLPVLVPVVVLGVIGIVAAVTSLIVDPPGGSTFVGVAGLLAAATAAEAFPLPIEGVNVGTGTTSLAIVAIVSTGVIYGWREAAVVGFLTMALVELGRGRRASRIVFNTSMYVCAGILAGLAAALPSGDSLWAIVAASCLGSIAFYLVDMLFLSAVIARSERASYIALLGRYLYATALPLFVMASL